MEEVLARDGRVLEVLSSGPPDGEVVLLHTGTPSAGRPFRRFVDEGDARDLRHLTYSRPGYAGSARHGGRSVADCVRDVEDIAEALGIARFFTAGWSGGGPHALATAALLGDRVTAAATLAFVWQGSDDRFVPFAHGEWVAQHVSGAQPRLERDHGHLSLVVGEYGRTLDDLVTAGRR